MQMRPPQKNRNQRNKNNRKPSSGNNVNRVYESNGPEGKVRGTPQQVVEKYLQLARDAQSANDRVLAESFFQFAEHYIRVLNVAQQQSEERRQQMQQEGARQDQDGARDSDDNDGDDNDGDGGDDYGVQQVAQHRPQRAEAPQPDHEPRVDRADRPREEFPRQERQQNERPRHERRAEADRPAPQPAVEALATIETDDEAASGPIATPEDHSVVDAPKPRRRTRRAAPKTEATPVDPAA
jgi:hypothetical protein